MNNTTMHRADRLTHLKIVVVALVAGIAVVGIGITAYPPGTDMSTQLEARAPMLKAGQPVIWSGSESSTIR
jgi:hypothetical protein